MKTIQISDKSFKILNEIKEKLENGSIIFPKVIVDHEDIIDMITENYDAFNTAIYICLFRELKDKKDNWIEYGNGLIKKEKYNQIKKVLLKEKLIMK